MKVKPFLIELLVACAFVLLMSLILGCASVDRVSWGTDGSCSAQVLGGDARDRAAEACREGTDRWTYDEQRCSITVHNAEPLARDVYHVDCEPVKAPAPKPVTQRAEVACSAVFDALAQCFPVSP